MRWILIITCALLTSAVAACHKPPEEMAARLMFATGTQGDISQVVVSDGNVDIDRKHFADVPFVVCLGWSENGLLATAHNFYKRSIYQIDWATSQASKLTDLPDELENAGFASFAIYGSQVVFVGRRAIHSFDLQAREWSSIPFPSGLALANEPGNSGVFLQDAAFFRDSSGTIWAFDPTSDEFYSFTNAEFQGWRLQCGAGDMLALSRSDGSLHTYTYDHQRRGLHPRASSRYGSSQSLPYVALTHGEDEWLLKGWDYGVFTTVHSSTLDKPTWRIPGTCVWDAVEIPEQSPTATAQ